MLEIELHRGSCRVHYGEKILSLEKFDTCIAGGTCEYYEVCADDDIADDEHAVDDDVDDAVRGPGEALE